MAQWEQAGLATQREVVRVELGAKLFVGGNVSLGVCEIGDKRLRRCSIFFLTQKKLMKK